MAKRGRRSFLRRSVQSAGAALMGFAGLKSNRTLKCAGLDSPGTTSARASESGPPRFKLGLVTYELAKDWDVETIIKNCEATGFEGVELRTTHKHGVEPSISKDRRAEVRKRFEGSRVRLVSLGSTCEYESADPAEVERNIEE